MVTPYPQGSSTVASGGGSAGGSATGPVYDLPAQQSYLPSASYYTHFSQQHPPPPPTDPAPPQQQPQPPTAPSSSFPSSHRNLHNSLLMLGWAANQSRALPCTSSSFSPGRPLATNGSLSSSGGVAGLPRTLSTGSMSSRHLNDETASTASSESGSSSFTNLTTATGAAMGATGRKRVRLSEEERLQRNRERNRVHARKTRKRKKVQMESIQTTIESLTEEGRRMRLAVMEWYTANILLVMRGPEAAGSQADKDSGLLSKYLEVQSFLDRTSDAAEGEAKEEGDDHSVSMIEDDDPQSKDESDLLPAAFNMSTLTHTSVQPPHTASSTDGEEGSKVGMPRSRCKYAPEERQRIRRERNRIHAKRTRDRRKKFMEDSEKVLSRLVKQNEDLRQMLAKIYGTRQRHSSGGGLSYAAREPLSVSSSGSSSSTVTPRVEGCGGVSGGTSAPLSIQCKTEPLSQRSYVQDAPRLWQSNRRPPMEVGPPAWVASPHGHGDKDFKMLDEYGEREETPSQYQQQYGVPPAVAATLQRSSSSGSSSGSSATRYPFTPGLTTAMLRTEV